MTLYKWSTDPATNATVDPSCPWPEGMAPSQVNDSARGNMAAIAKFRDDISGRLITTGTATAYVVTSSQGFDDLTSLDGAMIAFIPHVDSGAAPTLNVDGLGAKPLRGSTSANLLAGTLKTGSPYLALYRHSAGAFILHSYFVNQAEVPVGAGIDYWGENVPNDGWAFPYGQAISRTDYPVCFARLGTTYGSGNGTTTFNLPDKRGRFSAGKDNMGGSNAARLNYAVSSTILGAAGGSDRTNLVAGNLPPHTHSGTTGGMTRNNPHSHPLAQRGFVITPFAADGGTSVPVYEPSGASATNATDINHEHNITTNGGNGLSGSAFSNTPPTIVCNYIIRIK